MVEEHNQRQGYLGESSQRGHDPEPCEERDKGK